MIRQLLRSTAAAALVALTAGTADAQTKSFGMCSFDGYVCFGSELSLISGGTQLELLLQNQGSTFTPEQFSRITGFGLYEAPFSAPALSLSLVSTQFFNGDVLSTVDNFGLSQGAVSGLNTPNSGVEFAFGNDAIVPCQFGSVNGTSVDLATCETPKDQYLRVVLGINSTTSPLDFNALNLAVRFQSVVEGQGLPGSYKCYTSSPNVSGQDCSLNVGGGISSVPEPSTYALMGTGLLGLAGLARRRRQS